MGATMASLMALGKAQEQNFSPSKIAVLMEKWKKTFLLFRVN